MAGTTNNPIVFFGTCHLEFRLPSPAHTLSNFKVPIDARKVGYLNKLLALCPSFVLDLLPIAHHFLLQMLVRFSLSLLARQLDPHAC